MRIANHLHLPLRRADRRQDVIVNSFGVDVAECTSVDFAGPLIHAANCHDDLVGTLKRLEASMAAVLESDERRAGPAALVPTWLDEIRAAIDKAEER